MIAANDAEYIYGIQYTATITVSAHMRALFICVQVYENDKV